jgi:hypothetical protein
MRFIALAIACCLAASCAKDGGSNTSADSGTKPLSQRLNESNGFAVDSDGNWVPRNDRRSSFESQGESPYFQGGNSNQGKEYRTGDYARKSWWGNKDYGRSSYQGDTDANHLRQASRLDGQGALESGRTARGGGESYQTGGYRTGDARESSASRLDKPSDAETDVRRRVYQQPEIIDWSEQRKLSLEQSRGILGR